MKNQEITVTFFDKKGNEIKKVKRPNWKEQMKEKNQEIRIYKFYCLDKQGNLLDEFERTCKDKKHSLEIANEILSISLMKDLHKIETELCI